MTGWSERSARLALSLAVEGGEPVVSEAAVAEGGRAAWDRLLAGEFGEAAVARASDLDLPQVLASARACGARFVIPGDDEWPEPIEALRFCDSVQRRGGVPFGLWLRGPEHLARLLPRSVSIVGSRACSAYGSTIATDLAADLAGAGVAVVSGGAYGIDVAAHRGALAGRGSTICVLANGVDVGYPRGNAAIFDRLADSGLLISELPPGTGPSRVRFLSRNRLIAALSLGTVVVEAALRSGARNTASWALGCHRPVMAVPGPVDSRLSEAPHLLIRNGQAMLVTGADDVLEMVSPAGQHAQAMPTGSSRVTDTLDSTRLAVYEAVPARRRCSAGEIALVAGVSMPTCLAQLAELERADLVEGGEDGWRVAPQALAGHR